VRQRGPRTNPLGRRLPKMLRQHGNVLRSLPQRRHTNADHVEAIQQVLPETTLGASQSSVETPTIRRDDKAFVRDGTQCPTLAAEPRRRARGAE